MSGRSRDTLTSTGSAARFTSGPAAHLELECFIGKIETVVGSGTLTRVDGTACRAKVGDLLRQGDVIETAADGRVGIRFIDGTAFCVSNSARMVLEAFDCNGASPSALVDVTHAHGTFAFIAGEMMKAGRLAIDTPFANIRGRSRSGGMGMLSIAALWFAVMEDAHASEPQNIYDDGKNDLVGLLHITPKIRGMLPFDFSSSDETVTITRGSSSPEFSVISAQERVILQADARSMLDTLVSALTNPANTGQGGSSTDPNFLTTPSGPIIKINLSSPPSTVFPLISPSPSSSTSSGPPPPPVLPPLSPPPVNIYGVHWIKPISDNWVFQPGWNTGMVPVSSQNIAIDAIGIYTVTVTAPSTVLTGNSLLIGAGATLSVASGTFTISNATVTIANTGALETKGGTLIIDSTKLYNSGKVTAVTGEVDLIDSTVFNSGGTVQVDSGATLNFDGSAIVDGTVNIYGLFNSTGASSIKNAVISISSTGTLESTSGELDLNGIATFTNNGKLLATGNSLLVLNGGTINNTGGGTVQIDNGSTIELVNETVIGGQIELKAAGNVTTLEIGSNVILTGGTVRLSDDPNNVIVSNGSTATLVNYGDISGAGTIGDGSGSTPTDLTLDNYGDIAALYSTELVLDTGSNAITNEAGGTLEAQNGATLEIVSDVTNLNATSSQIVANDGGTVELVGNTITGGTIALDGSAAATELQIEGTVNLSATTTTTLSDSGQNAIVSTHDEITGAATLVNYGDISGAGTIGDGSGSTPTDLTLDNYGDIAAAGAAELVLDTGSNAILNNATLEATAGGTLEIVSDVTNNGTILAKDGGTVELVNNTVTGGAINLDGSSLATQLQIEGSVTLTGGTLTLTDSTNNSIIGTLDEGLPTPSTLINYDTISGAGSIGDGSGNLTLDNYGTVYATGTNTLIIDTGTNAVTNFMTLHDVGTLAASAGSTLEIDDDVINSGIIAALAASGSAIATVNVTGNITGSGSIQIFDLANVEINGSVSGQVVSTTYSGQTVYFEDGQGKLVLDQSTQFSGLITGASLGAELTPYDLIDLKDFSYTAHMSATASYDSASDISTIVFSDGTTSNDVTLKFSGDYTYVGWTFSDDGSHNTLINVSPALYIAPGTTLTLQGDTITQDVVNDGGILTSSNNVSTIDGNITGTGTIEIKNNTTLVLNGDVGSGQQIVFLTGGGATKELVLGDPGDFYATPISGFTHGNNAIIYLPTLTWGFTSSTVTITAVAGNTETVSTSGESITVTTNAGDTLTTVTVTDIVTGTSGIFNLSGGFTGASSSFTFAKDTGTGGTYFLDPLTISSGATLELHSASTDSVFFLNDAGNTGTLLLDDPIAYSGTIFGFAGTSTISDTIVLKGIAFDSGTTWNYTENSLGSGGTLTLYKGTTIVDSINFFGSYTTANFTVQSDGHGGTLITDPPTSTSTSSGATTSTAGVGSTTGLLSTGTDATLTTNTDSVHLVDGTNHVFGTDQTTNNGDTITGGTGSDTLTIDTGPGLDHTYVFGDGESGHFDFGLTNFENLTLTDAKADASHEDTITVTFDSHFKNGETLTVDGSDLHNLTGANLTVDAHLATHDSFVFIGSDKADTLIGGSHNDTITGGGGGDTLTGGGGNDTFVFKAITDSQPGADHYDTITDFAHSSDHIDLSAILGLNSNNQAVEFQSLTSMPTSIAAHTIDIVTINGNTIVCANASDVTQSIDHADMEIHLNNVTNVQSNDFILHH
ncbi:MAG: hypothetical protein P8Y71_18190 [Pseudolabrys sp.]